MGIGQKGMNHIICFLVIGGLSCSALSYIPSSDFILQNVVKNHGRSRYVIEQEVTFSLRNMKKVVYETWHVEGVTDKRNGQRDVQLNLHLLAKADNFVIQRLYKNRLVYQKTNKKSMQKQQWPLEFLEPWFLNRSLRQMQRDILKHRMAGSALLNWNPSRLLNISDRQNIILPLSLSRHQGEVMYTYQRDTEGPGLWIEQDKFLIRKLRFQSDVEVLAKEYGDYSRGLKFPKNRILNDGGVSILLRVLKVNSLSANNKMLKKKMSLRSLRSSSFSEIDEPLIEEFYTRFR